MRRGLIAMALAFVAVTLTATLQADQRYAVTGMILRVDRDARTFTASIDEIPGFMEAMTMPFRVREAKELDGLAPGAVVDFTLVVEQDASFAESVRVRRHQNLEQDPLTARRLSIFRDVTGGRESRALGVGEAVPDFTLVDQHRQRVTLSAFRGRVVAINFMYTTCQLPDFCVRMVNHFGTLQERFRDALGRDLVLLTISFDPVRDQPDVLARYAARWHPAPAWHFLTGPVPDVRRVLGLFGVAAFLDDGLMDHSLHTIVIGRDGRIAAHVEGNQFPASQLVDLTRAVLDAK
jgi:protein SCO1/2